MAFSVKKNADKRKVVLELQFEDEGEGQKTYKYLVPRIKKSEAILAQKLRGRSVDMSDEEAVGMYLVADIIDGIEPIDDAPKFSDFLDNYLSDESSDDLLKEVVRLSTSSVARLISEGAEVR